MTARRTHIVGAGIAGLSAALAVTAEGGEAVLYEAAPQPGGRCRTLHPADGFDPRQRHPCAVHGQRGVRSISCKTIGARERWVEPEPKGLPLYDGSYRRDAPRRPLALVLAAAVAPPAGADPARSGSASCGSSSPSKDCPVAAIIGKRPIMDSLIEPLTVAVLNTPAAQASAQRLACALRQLIRPGAGRLLVARNGLSQDLIEPAVATLRAAACSILTGQRLRTLLTVGERVIGLALTDRTVMLGPDDRVILALPPYEVERLLPTLPVPTQFEPILNVHYRMPGLSRPRFIGFTGTLAQWALIRDDHVSVTVSAADAVIDRNASEVAARIWREIAPALRCARPRCACRAAARDAGGEGEARDDPPGRRAAAPAAPAAAGESGPCGGLDRLASRHHRERRHGRRACRIHPAPCPRRPGPPVPRDSRLEDGGCGMIRRPSAAHRSARRPARLLRRRRARHPAPSRMPSSGRASPSMCATRSSITAAWWTNSSARARSSSRTWRRSPTAPSRSSAPMASRARWSARRRSAGSPCSMPPARSCAASISKGSAMRRPGARSIVIGHRGHVEIEGTTGQIDGTRPCDRERRRRR